MTHDSCRAFTQSTVQFSSDSKARYLECTCSANDAECQDVCVMYSKEQSTTCRHIKQSESGCAVYDRLADNYCREDGYCNIGENKTYDDNEELVCKQPQQVYCAREYFDAVSCVHSLQSFSQIEA